MNKIILCITVYLLFVQSGLYAQDRKLPPITPRWALEHIVWEDSANNRVSSEKLVNLYLEHKMPVGAIIIDSPWSTAYNNFDWDTTRYPGSAEMIRNFSKQNVKVILWLTGCVNTTGIDMPVQKHPSFDEVVAKKYAINNEKISHWWKGDGLHIDFTNPAAIKWWNAQLDKVLLDGVYGFKVDQGEIYFGDTVQTSVGAMTNVEFRPYYYNSMFQYITSRKAEGAIVGRPFSHQGGVEASVGQLSLGWCGDFQGSWSGLKLQINNIYKSAEMGYGAPGCEVGGFFKARSSKDELIRYAQFGALTACMINGGENGAFTNHLPWYQGKEAASCYLQAVWLHSQLIPYLFSAIVKAHKSGGSLINHVSYEQESHMVGDYIFTKAVTSQNNTVSFKLPEEGKWMDFWTKTIYAGGTIITRTYPLSQFPLFIKAGAIIPMNITNSFSGIGDSALTGKQTILIIPDKGESTCQYFRPLGDGTDYDSVRITYDGQLNELKVEGENKLPYAFVISNCAKPVKVNNADAWKYDEKKQELLLMKHGNKFGIKLTF
jgi:alpha-glucosidase (family GH31 glycosyl hydrolase)